MVTQNIKLMTGGGFSVDSIGPERHAEVLSHVRLHMDEYLSAFQDMYLGTAFDAIQQSKLYLPSFLGICRDLGADPSRLKTLASALLTQYDSVMFVYDNVTDVRELWAILKDDEVMRTLQRLATKRVELRGLLGSL